MDGKENGEEGTLNGNDSETRGVPLQTELHEGCPEKPLLQSTVTSLDDLLKELGLGPWNCVYFIVTSMCYMIEVVNLYGGEFLAPTLPFTCADSLLDDVKNLSSQSFSTVSSQCLASPRDSIENISEDTTACQSFIYDHSTYYSTITDEFDLVCGREYLQHWFQISFTLGSLVGCVVSGIIADRYGRQMAVWYGSICIVLCTVIMTFVDTLAVILVARFILGIFTTTLLTTSFALGMECIPMQHRSTYGLAVGVPYAAMVSILALIAYAVRRWRWIQMIASCPLLVVLLTANPLVMKESPRWLVEEGRTAEAAMVIRWAGRINGRTERIPIRLEEILQQIHQREHHSKLEGTGEQYSLAQHFYSMFSFKPLLKLTVTAIVVEVIIGTVYISLPLSSDGFKSPFLFMGAMGVAELPAYTLTIPVAVRLSRRPLVAACLLITMTLEITLALLSYLEVENDWPHIIVSSFAYNFISFGFMVALTLFIELYPTSIRSLGTSLCFFGLNVGFNIPPILDVFLSKGSPWISLLIYGSSCTLGAILILLLPETRNRPLLQTVTEYIEYYDTSSISGDKREVF